MIKTGKKKIKRRVSETVLIIVLSIIIIMAFGASTGLHQLTVIEWWKPALACALLSLPLTFLTARYFTRLTRPLIRFAEYPLAFIFYFSVMLAAFYTLNYCLSDHSSGYEYNAPVVGKYSEERTRSHRTGRRGYHSEKYRVYIVELKMKDGKIKKMQKSLSEYNRIKKGKKVKIYVEEGLFKIPVVKTKNKQLN